MAALDQTAVGPEVERFDLGDGDRWAERDSLVGGFDDVNGVDTFDFGLAIRLAQDGLDLAPGDIDVPVDRIDCHCCALIDG